MTIEAMKQALEALDSDNPDVQLRAAITLRQAIAQSDQESDDLTAAYMSGFFNGKKKREWVGLTDEEIDRLNFLSVEGCQCSFGYVDNVEEFAQSIEAKLREKNGC